MRKFTSKQKIRMALMTGFIFYSGFAFAQAINDDCLGAINITPESGSACSNPVFGSSVDATMSSIALGCTNVIDSLQYDVWYSFVATSVSHEITLSNVSPTNPSVLFHVYTLSLFSGSCSALTQLGCEGGGELVGVFPAVNVLLSNSNLTVGNTYYIQIAGGNSIDMNSTLIENGINFGLCVRSIGDPLPVTMDKLSGKLISGNISQLSWNTFAEQNNKGFEIQRSADGKTFTSAGFVSSKATAGNSSEQIGYRFTDRESVNGAVYYRLQQTDIDGKTAYSNIVRLATKENGGFDVVVAPNPVKNSLTVNTYGVQGKEAKVYLADITGKIVRTVTVTGAETAVDMTGLPEGMYLVKYLDAEHNQTIKVSKQ